jgi:hypothetical protein
MSPTVKILAIVLICAVVVIGGYLLYRGQVAQARAAEAVVWETVDQNYVPQDDVESYIKDDAIAKGLLPVYIRNYGNNRKILGRFKGTNYAQPREGVLSAMNPGLEDWKLIEIKYKAANGLEVLRAVLYVKSKGAWSVVDSGTLME